MGIGTPTNARPTPASCAARRELGNPSDPVPPSVRWHVSTVSTVGRVVVAHSGSPLPPPPSVPHTPRRRGRPCPCATGRRSVRSPLSWARARSPLRPRPPLLHRSVCPQRGLPRARPAARAAPPAAKPQSRGRQPPHSAHQRCHRRATPAHAASREHARPHARCHRHRHVHSHRPTATRCPTASYTRRTVHSVTRSHRHIFSVSHTVPHPATRSHAVTGPHTPAPALQASPGTRRPLPPHRLLPGPPPPSARSAEAGAQRPQPGRGLDVGWAGGFTKGGGARAAAGRAAGAAGKWSPGPNAEHPGTAGRGHRPAVGPASSVSSSLPRAP